MSNDQPTLSTPLELLHAHIATRQAKVGVIGLGYVGLPLCHALHAGGMPVIGFDVDPSKIEALAEGRSYLDHLGPHVSQDLARSERFEATTDFARLGEPDVILVCVPTPVGEHEEPDLSYVHRSAEDIGACVRSGQLIVLESTTYPGTTREEFLPRLQLEERGLTLGKDVFVAYSPEREDPGSKHTTKSIPKLVGGLDEASTGLAVSLYQAGVEQVVSVSSAEVAEAAKILENVFRSVNIAMVNEMKTILDAMQIDVWEVIEAASTKPFGFMPFFPGPGLGGHCIPIDPFYLAWKAREVGRPTRFIELAGQVNRAMPAFVIEKTLLALNDRGKAVKGSRILVLGLAYKKDVDDVRESPSFELIEGLGELGAEVDYHDPHVERTHRMRRFDLGMESKPLTRESIEDYDALILATDHTAIDYDLLADHAPLLIDTRGALRSRAGRMGERLVKA